MSGDLIRSEVSIADARSGDAIEVNRVILSDFRGMVCLTFKKRCDCLTITPQEALTMSEALGRQAYKSRFGDFPDGGTKQTVEQLRIRLVNGFSMMMKNKVPSAKDRKALATALADRACSMLR